ncbi:hypothetical protein M8C21_030519 [Ambrosia artemisiifolia]|uniref:Uncharacterized protein n=1 Tax=Ambrosia artemisiifolia TaxID=4212 RepID=A0AAD5G351_AMBAR|nr:hypothetical protein M8C21_030519 [Ambrosia artemisiifolia]
MKGFYREKHRGGTNLVVIENIITFFFHSETLPSLILASSEQEGECSQQDQDVEANENTVSNSSNGDNGNDEVSNSVNDGDNGGGGDREGSDGDRWLLF